MMSTPATLSIAFAFNSDIVFFSVGLIIDAVPPRWMLAHCLALLPVEL
jgi:hypothetical protein